jgi:hypothetical protein
MMNASRNSLIVALQDPSRKRSNTTAGPAKASPPPVVHNNGNPQLFMRPNLSKLHQEMLMRTKEEGKRVRSMSSVPAPRVVEDVADKRKSFVEVHLLGRLLKEQKEKEKKVRHRNCVSV